MSAVVRIVRVLLFSLFVVAAACVEEIDRPENITPTVASAPVVAPTSSAGQPAAPQSTPITQPNIIVVTTPSATVVSQATVTPVAPPPPTAVPTATSVPPSSTPIPIATDTPTPAPTATSTVTSTPTRSPASRLVLDVQGPLDGDTVQADALVVYGSTTPGAIVTINGEQTSVAETGRFQMVVSLVEGVNVIDVLATDDRGGRETITRTVNLLPPQPFILIVNKPENLSVVSDSTVQLIGLTSPDAVVSVNGVTIDVDLGGIFETTLTLGPDLNFIDVLATDSQGEVLSTTLSIFYAP